MPSVKEAGWYRAGYTLGLLLRLWRWTLRIESRGTADRPGSWMLAFWHGRTIGVLMEHIDASAVAMASRSADGALAAGALVATGIRVARGSSGKGGGEALVEMERLILDGVVTFTALTVDGPRGPWRKVKPGTVLLARRLQIPIIPASFSCRRPWILRSWDRMVLPRPFSKITVAWGAPIHPGTLPEDIEGATEVVGRALDDLGSALDLEMAGRELWPSRE
jgi:hypothetical protein